MAYLGANTSTVLRAASGMLKSCEHYLEQKKKGETH